MKFPLGGAILPSMFRATAHPLPQQNRRNPAAMARATGAEQG
ncbi:hypothetical protein [Pseudoroseomonas ludipueritiae]